MSDLEKRSDKSFNAHAYQEDSMSLEEKRGQGELQRKLKTRHIAMIRWALAISTHPRRLLTTKRFFFSIGGVIGTGLFLGTAGALESGGPIGLLLGYSVMGTVVYCVMISLGEMIAYLPIPGGHIALAERFVDPGLAFAMV
jgi:yeast amino acid transporter